jgi:hypothetical protein
MDAPDLVRASIKRQTTSESMEDAILVRLTLSGTSFV